MSDKLTEIFLNEANDLIIDLEKSLLSLKADGDKKESVSSIFRAMHTLKGASGMFGYGGIQTLTHHLENLYQDIRDEKRVLSDEIIAITFTTIDILRGHLSESPNAIPRSAYDELLNQIQQLHTVSDVAALNETSTPQLSTYYIKFAPNGNVFRHGTNPLYLVDDLLALGNGFCLPSMEQLPDLENLIVDECYTSFEVVLTTDKSGDEINTVFLFVEDDCKVEIRKMSLTLSTTDIVIYGEQFYKRDQCVPLGFDHIQQTVEKRLTPSMEKVNAGKSKASSIRVSSDRLDELMNLVSELVTTQARLAVFAGDNHSTELQAISENIEKITRRLRDNTFTMTLVPLETLAVRFQRLVNDLSKDLGKEVEFLSTGLDTKIDKSLIDKLTDPILHILRNCIDHGIEGGQERLRSGKNLRGTISLRSFYSGSNVIIEISDDGAGINLQKVRSKAVTQKLINANDSISDQELLNLILLPGFSTAQSVTGISGRGVGMDVVKRNIEDIRGSINIDTVNGKGTTFTIKMPITVSIMDGLLVKVGETNFILPLSSVTKCFEVTTSSLESTFNSWITLDGERIPFVFLRNEFNIDMRKPLYSQVIKVPYEGEHVGLAVDQIIGEYQAVLKPLDKFYKGQDEFSGATILGDGSVALVLDPTRTIKNLIV
jgi:two-component system, chemotaxis family, sensor kinase CheA